MAFFIGGTAGAIVGSSIIAGTAGLIGVAIANNAADKAADTQGAAVTDAAAVSAGASTEAARIQAESAAAAIAEQRRQFDAMQEIMKPWVDQGTSAMSGLDQYQQAGSDSLKQQRALMGLDGQEAQRAAISALSGSSQMDALAQQSENAMMQSGAATGGLRGGNMQGALAQFRPSMLSSLINQQYSKLGGMIDMGQSITMNRAALGQASASGVGAAGMQSASSIGNLLTQQGNALAGGALGAGNAMASGILGGGNALAQSQLARGQNWASLPGQIIQGGLLGYGFANPKTDLGKAAIYTAGNEGIW